jgi:hypothetical protein
MADGNLVRQSNVGKDSVVFGPTVYDVPLLPYEKELIKTIGITEDEYRQFTAEVKRRGAVRPAAYDHIPDIRNEPTTIILVNLAISLVMTGVAYLLTPKPKAPEASKRTQLDLGSVNASNRFTPSRGFDSLMELADYGAPIPIIFGRYIENKNVGGMLATPKLVWSRMFSHGTQQSAKLMFVVGEHGHATGVGPDGIIEPDLEGIFLGNNALDALFEDFFAFYWKRNSPMLINGLTDSASNFNRLRSNNLFHGTNGDGSKGDPFSYAGDQDVFECPDSSTSNSKSFCHAFSPTNNIQFGMYGAIANGTGYKVNFEVVSIIDGTPKKQRHASAIRRIKITGANGRAVDVNDDDAVVKARKRYMEGAGRQYSPRMGLVKLIREDGTKLTPDPGSLTERDKINVNDTVEFLIKPGGIPPEFYQRSNNRGGEPVDDINSTVESEQLAADEAMQVGEQFAIGNAVFVVTKRRLPQFDPVQKESQKITLRCISTKESQDARIGFVNDNTVVEPPDHFVADGKGVEPTFYPITRIASGIVRNNKPAVVTEIGIRSKVFQRLNGLCSFNATPSPDELNKFDDQEVQVRSGTYTGTITRTSVFQVYVRKAGVDNGNNSFSFRRIDIFFAVRGNSPAEQYNFIRFKHPQKNELEFKFVPIAGAELANLDDDQKIVLLNASISEIDKPTIVEKPDVGNLGKFIVETAGVRLKKRDIEKNKEFLRKPKKVVGSSTKSIPNAVEQTTPLPDETSGRFRRAIAIDIGEGAGNLDPPGRQGAFMWEIFGDPSADSGGVGTQRSKDTREVIGDKWIRIRWTVEKGELAAGHYALVGQNQKHVWRLKDYSVIGSSPGWSKGDVFLVKRGENSTAAEGEPGYGSSAYASTNKFRGNHPSGSLIRWSGWYFRVEDIDTTSAPEGRAGGYYYEVFGNPENKAVGTTKLATKAIQTGSKKIRFRLKGKVVLLPSGHFTGLTKKWVLDGPIEVIDDDGTNANWDKGDTFEHTETITASNNPFYWTYNKVGFQYKITDVAEIAGTGTFTGETEFEKRSQYADISFYRGLVNKSNDNEPEHAIVYVNEVLENSKVPQYNGLTICGLSLKASRNFTSLDSLRVWLGQGIPVRRLHPDVKADTNNPYDESSDPYFKRDYGPSNLFTDLAFYLLTDKQGGAGNLTGMSPENAFLLNVEDFKTTSRFIREQELFFNGVVAERTNLRQYIMDVAPYFLCNFVMMDGKFSLLPAIPAYKKSGKINRGPVPIDQLFTSGNILEDTYKIEYLSSEERRNFSAVVRYRFESRNKLPEERVMRVKIKGSPWANLPQEQFDLTQFCTSRDHAVKVAKYFLGLRKYVTHTVSFSTTVEGLNLRAGSYIKVITESSPYTEARNGTVSDTGVVTSVEPIKDGMYSVTFFKTGSEDIEGGLMQISDGKVSDTKFHDSVFSINLKEKHAHVYVVEQLTFSAEGTVDIVASEHQCNDDRHSELANFIHDTDSVVVEDIQ